MADEPSRRAGYRSDAADSVRIRMDDPKTDIAAQCKDLSSRGLRAVVDHQFHVGAEIEVAIPMDTEELSASGKVLRSTPVPSRPGSFEVAIVLNHSHAMFERVLKAHIFGLEMKRLHGSRGDDSAS